jgi:hypothetical protein
MQGLVGSSSGYFGLSRNSSHVFSHLRAEGDWFQCVDVYATCVQKLGEANLDIEIGVRQLYRRLSIPAVVEQVEEEGEDVAEAEQ